MRLAMIAKMTKLAELSIMKQISSGEVKGTQAF